MNSELFNFPNQNLKSLRIEPSAFNQIYFAFLGEFGYELISWIPYLLYLKRTLNITVNTISRRGSKLFYYFSDNHIEVGPELIGDMWGEPESYMKLHSLFNINNIINPLIINGQIIQFSINSCKWLNNDIHKVINTENYIVPSYSHINDKLPFDFDRKFVVLNNKFQRQWYNKYKAPINYFSKNDLIRIKELLYKYEYGIVYNHFIEQTSYDEYFEWDDRNIFGQDTNSIDLNDYYKLSNNIEYRNRLQITVLNKAEFVIGVQGGNLYLPALCRKNIFMLLRDGQYLDYLEFSRIFNIEIGAFYEAEHLISSLGTYLSNKTLEYSSKFRNIYLKAIFGENNYEAIANKHISYDDTNINFDNKKNSSKNFISICIPTFNRANQLSRAIESCLTQSYQNFEIIIIDDGSSDTTEQLVRQYNSPKLKYFFKEHSGIPETRNLAIEQANYDFIFWLASDDWIEKNTLEIYNKYINLYPKKEIFSADIRVVNDKPFIANYPDWSNSHDGIMEYCLTRGTPIADGGSMVKKSLYHKVGLYNPIMKRAQDYDFWCRCIINNLFNFQKIDGIYYNYFTQEDSASGLDIYKKNLKYERLVIAEIIKNSILKDIFTNFDWENNSEDNLFKSYRIIADNFLKFRSLHNSIHYLSKCIEIKPDQQIIHQIQLLKQQIDKINELLPKLKQKIDSNNQNLIARKDYEELIDIIEEDIINPINDFPISQTPRNSGKRMHNTKTMIVSQFYKMTGGTENLALDLYNALKQFIPVVEISYVHIQNNKNAISETALFENIHFFSADNITDLIDLIENKFDSIILLADLQSDLTLEFGKKLSKNVLKFIYINVNNEHIKNINTFPKNWDYYRNLLNLFDKVVVMSVNSMAYRLLVSKNYPFEIINSGIPDFVIDKSCDYYKKYFNIDNGKPKLIYPALVTPSKKQIELIELFANEQSIDLFFIGDIYNQNLDYNERFLNLVNQYNHIYYFSPMQRHKIVELISNSHALVLPSESEGCPLILMEAMQNGIPWIANDKIEFSKNLEGGISCELGSFVTNLYKLLNVPEFRIKVLKNIFSIQQTKYNIKNTAYEFFKLIGRVFVNFHNKKQLSKPLPKKVIVASDLMKDKDLTQVDSESDFKNTILEVISKYKPTKLLETGTYLGEGTTKIIIESLISNQIYNFLFYSIEVNPNHISQAKENLDKRGFLKYVTLLNGLSVPRTILPTLEEIKNYTVDKIEFDKIIVDHHEKERALRYFAETNFNDVEDNLIDRVLIKFDYQPDFVLLDSAGHIGYIEFQYLISKLKSKCIIALDDVNHIKHYKSYQVIKNDERFTILRKSDEKFGFMIAIFEPSENEPASNNSFQNINFEKSDEFNFNGKNILWIRTDSIGDSILSIGMLKSIKERFTNSNITVLVQEHLEEIYMECPFVDNILKINKIRFLNDVDYRLSFIESFLKISYDYSINSIYSRDILSDLFGLAINIKIKIAMEGDFSNIDDTTKNKNDSNYDFLIPSTPETKNELARHADLMKFMGFKDYKSEPWIWLNQSHLDFVDEQYKLHKINKDKVITLFAGGQHNIRDYRYFQEALSRVNKINDYTIIAVGTEREFNLHKEMFYNSPLSFVNLCGKTTILEAAAIVLSSKIAVGTETSFSHIACAGNIPNITIMGGGHFGRFIPYSILSSIVCLPLKCYACNWNCQFEIPFCIQNIDTDIIRQAIEDRLNRALTKIQVYCQDYTNSKLVATENNISKYLEGLDCDILKFSKPDAIEGHNKNDIKNLNYLHKQNNNYKVYKYKCTAIVSMYNSERFMEGLLEDLISQTLFKKGELEIILIDSASPQNEYQIIAPYIECYPQIQYLRTSVRETLYQSWNRAIEISQGEYITSANTDDRHRNDALELLSSALDKFPEYGLVYPDLLITDIENETFENTKTLRRYDFPDYNLGTYLSNSIFGAQPVWRKSVHSEVGMFDTSYKIGGDYEFFIRLVKRFGAIHFRETLGLFLESNSALSNPKNIDVMLLETYKTLNFHRNGIKLYELYPELLKNMKDTSAYFAALWDFGCLCLLSPYNDFELALKYFDKCKELGNKSGAILKIKDMYFNNIAVIAICAGERSKGIELFKQVRDLDVAKQNLLLINEIEMNPNHKLNKSGLAPKHFKIALIDHSVLTNSRLTQSLYLDKHNQIMLSQPTNQFFWDVYLGTGGIAITKLEKERIQKLSPRSPKTEGLIKFYREIYAKEPNYSGIKNLTSFSAIFWLRDYTINTNLLIRTPAALGDCLAITSVISNLKNINPKLNITIACMQNESKIFENNSMIENIILINSFDEVIFQSETDNLEIIDYADLINKLPEYYNGLSYLDIIANIAGIKLVDKNYYYYSKNSENDLAKKLFSEFRVKNKTIGIHFHTNKDQRRNYPFGKELIKEMLALEPNLNFINFGTQPIDFEDERIIDCAKMNMELRVQIALAKFCDEFLVIDSLFFHIGHNLHHKKTTVIFGPTNPNLCGNPESNFYYLSNTDLDCLGCYWQLENGIKCMNELLPEQLAKNYLENKSKKATYYNGDKILDIDITQSGIRSFEELLYNFYSKNRIAVKLKIIDENRGYPEYAKKWNGIEISRL